MAIGVVSQNPALVAQDINQPTVTEQRGDVVAVITSTIALPIVDIPLKAGQTYFIAASGQGSLILFLDP